MNMYNVSARFGRSISFAISGLLLLAFTSGCNRYTENRVMDLCDVFQAGIGGTMESPGLPTFPPAIGLHIQATEYLNLGAIYFNGYSAEEDGRGFFAGREERLRAGFFWWQTAKIRQSGNKSYFKRADTAWAGRMRSPEMSWRGIPAKRLDYLYCADKRKTGTPLLTRGTQYWENYSAEIAICDPFITHAGVTMRLGVDASEIFDFFLGIIGIDFRHDDMTVEEYDTRGLLSTTEYAGMSASEGITSVNASIAREKDGVSLTNNDSYDWTGVIVELQIPGTQVPYYRRLAGVPAGTSIYLDFDDFSNDERGISCKPMLSQGSVEFTVRCTTPNGYGQWPNQTQTVMPVQ